jgi:hypothetical protein
MPFIKSLAFKYLAYCSKLMEVILLFSEIMPAYSRYTKKGLVYITITAPSSHQPSSCFKCIKLNIYSSCNIYSVSNAEYIYLAIYLYTL